MAFGQRGFWKDFGECLAVAAPRSSWWWTMAANWEDRRWNSSLDDRIPQIPKQIEGAWGGHGTVCACCGEVHGCVHHDFGCPPSCSARMAPTALNRLNNSLLAKSLSRQLCWYFASVFAKAYSWVDHVRPCLRQIIQAERGQLRWFCKRGSTP